MFNRIGKFGATVAALAAVAVGASAVAGAATSNNSSSSGAAATAAQGYAPQGAPPPGGANGAGPRHAPETPLTGDTAAKVKAAALAKVPGGTIERVETDSDHGSPYEAHVTKADGTQLEVLVNKDFEVTAVNTMRHP
jgi:uncharacterized membrane protein YkoI